MRHRRVVVVVGQQVVVEMTYVGVVGGGLVARQRHAERAWLSTRPQRALVAACGGDSGSGKSRGQGRSGYLLRWCCVEEGKVIG